MEYRTEFSLKQRLELWKASLNIDLTSDDINKLQDTLIDQMFDLQKQGFSEEESFFIAQKRLGYIELAKSEQGISIKKATFKKQVLLYLNGALLFLILDKIISILYLISAIATDLIGITDKFYNLSPITIAISLTLFISIVIYKKYANNKISFSCLKNTFLIAIITIGIYIFKYLLNSFYTNFWTLEKHTPLAKYLIAYEFLIITLISLLSFIVFFRSKKHRKMKLAY